MIALNDARKITGRDIISGEYQLNIFESGNTLFNPYSFIGIVNYLLILDMIGEIFEISTFSTNKHNNIYKALKQFSLLKNDDIDTCIAIRNSLAHNYGLINIPKDTKEYSTKRHKFVLDNQPNPPLIEYPHEGQGWIGNFNDKSESSSTTIGYIKICDLVEEVYINLKTKAEEGLVLLALNQNIEELKARFTIVY